MTIQAGAPGAEVLGPIIPVHTGEGAAFNMLWYNDSEAERNPRMNFMNVPDKPFPEEAEHRRARIELNARLCIKNCASDGFKGRQVGRRIPCSSAWLSMAKFASTSFEEALALYKQAATDAEEELAFPRTLTRRSVAQQPEVGIKNILRRLHAEHKALWMHALPSREARNWYSCLRVFVFPPQVRWTPFSRPCSLNPLQVQSQIRHS